MKLTLGLYGLFLLLVAFNGNASKLVTDLKADMPHYLPWLVVLAVIGALYDFEDTHAFGVAVLLLVIFAFTLKNYGTLESEVKSIWSQATGNAKATG